GLFMRHWAKSTSASARSTPKAIQTRHQANSLLQGRARPGIGSLSGNGIAAGHAAFVFHARYLLRIKAGELQAHARAAAVFVDDDGPQILQGFLKLAYD